MESFWIRIGVSLLLTTLALACSPEGEEHKPKDTVGKVHFSHAVVVGRVVNLMPTPNLSPNSYTVIMQLACVIKDSGHRISQDTNTINITEAGHIEGLCHAAPFQVGQMYIAFLKADYSELLKPWEAPLAASEGNLLEAAKACHITPVVKTGTCPQPATPCVPDDEGYSDDHSRGHEHHEDEDSQLGHSHEDHHRDDPDFEHDHDHSMHHDDDHHDDDGHHDHTHTHHGDEDGQFEDSHDDHHHDDPNYAHDHDHSFHHHDNDHDHDDHHKDGEHGDEHDHDDHHHDDAGASTGGQMSVHTVALGSLLSLLAILIFIH